MSPKLFRNYVFLFALRLHGFVTETNQSQCLFYVSISSALWGQYWPRWPIGWKAQNSKTQTLIWKAAGNTKYAILNIGMNFKRFRLHKPWPTSKHINYKWCWLSVHWQTPRSYEIDTLGAILPEMADCMGNMDKQNEYEFWMVLVANTMTKQTQTHQLDDQSELKVLNLKT